MNYGLGLPGPLPVPGISSNPATPFNQHKGASRSSRSFRSAAAAAVARLTNQVTPPSAQPTPGATPRGTGATPRGTPGQRTPVATPRNNFGISGASASAAAAPGRVTEEDPRPPGTGNSMSEPLLD